MILKLYHDIKEMENSLRLDKSNANMTYQYLVLIVPVARMVKLYTFYKKYLLYNDT